MVRFKNRYLVLLVRPKDGRHHEGIGAGLAPAIRAAVALQHGEAFLEEVGASLSVPFYHHLSGVAVVRVGRAQHAKVLQSCLQRLSLVDYRGVAVALLKLTGAQRVAKRAAGEHVARLMRGLKLSAEQRATAESLQERLDALFS